MTDPIQTTNPPQQWQQWTTDDILGWADIFATIPVATKEEDLGYEALDKQYQFDPIPETIEDIQIPMQTVPTQAPVQPVTIPVPTLAPVMQAQAPVEPATIPVPAPAPVVQPQVPVTAPVSPAQPVMPPVPLQEVHMPETIAPIVEEKKEVQVPQKIEEIEVPFDQKLQTDVQKKFGELFSTTKKIYELKEKVGVTEESFDILWADNDKLYVSYRFLLDETNEPILFITKIEQDKETEEETVNELRFTFNEETLSLEVVVNDMLLFDEVEDFTQDQKKKLQVVDKINKFTFLASEELRKMEKEIKEKEEAERERRKLQEIFRNF